MKGYHLRRAFDGADLGFEGSDKPIRTYNVAGLYDELAEEGKIFQEEEGGVRVLVDLKNGGKAAAIQAVENVLSRLKA